MLAAETVFEALKTGDASSKRWRVSPQIEQAGSKRIVGVRNFIRISARLYTGLIHAGLHSSPADAGSSIHALTPRA